MICENFDCFLLFFLIKIDINRLAISYYTIIDINRLCTFVEGNEVVESST